MNKKNKFTIIGIVLMILTFYFYNEYKNNVKEDLIKKNRVIKPYISTYYDRKIINENYHRNGEFKYNKTDDSLNISNLLQEHTGYYDFKKKDFSLKESFNQRLIGTMSFRDFYFADDNNVLVALPYIGFINEKGEEEIKGGIYKINVETKEVSLFDFLPKDKIKTDYLYICTDGLRVFTNNYYRPPGGDYIHRSSPEFPFPGFEQFGNNKKYTRLFNSTSLYNSKNNYCIPLEIENKSKQSYQEYQGKDKYLTNISNSTRTYKLNNEGLYLSFRKDRNESIHKNFLYSYIKDDQILSQKRTSYNFSIFDNKAYKYILTKNEKDQSCYAIQESDDNFKFYIKDNLLCPTEHLDKKRLNGHDNIEKSKKGYIVYADNNDFPDGYNLALYDLETLKFKEYIIKEKDREVKNLIISPDGCGIAYRKFNFKGNSSIYYKNLCDL